MTIKIYSEEYTIPNFGKACINLIRSNSKKDSVKVLVSEKEKPFRLIYNTTNLEKGRASLEGFLGAITQNNPLISTKDNKAKEGWIEIYCDHYPRPPIKEIMWNNRPI
jgi:hypothetical protein